ncbi:MAG: hypothetical protein ABSE76_00730, partial [Minisyncoccia bacterium]
WTSTDTLYGTNGKAASETWYNGTAVYQTAVWTYNSDGTVHDIAYANISGQAYTSYDVVYGTNGKAASATYSNGMTETWTYNSDSSLHEVVYKGITGQAWTSTDTLYGTNGKAASETWYNGTAVYQTAVWTYNSDGTVHDIHYYGILGQKYTNYDVLYANGKVVSTTYYNKDGTTTTKSS